MPWRTPTVMDERARFVFEAEHTDLSFSELCRRYNISRPTGYKWIGRHREDGVAGLDDRSHRPRSLYTFRLIAPSRRPTRTHRAGRPWGPDSRRRCGICRTASIRHRAFVSTTWDPTRFPFGVTTPSVQLDACASSPIYLSIGVLPLGWDFSGSRTSQIAPPLGRTPTA